MTFIIFLNFDYLQNIIPRYHLQINAHIFFQEIFDLLIMDHFIIINQFSNLNYHHHQIIHQ